MMYNLDGVMFPRRRLSFVLIYIYNTEGWLQFLRRNYLNFTLISLKILIPGTWLLLVRHGCLETPILKLFNSLLLLGRIWMSICIFLAPVEIFIFLLPHPTYAPQSQVFRSLCSWGRPWSSQIWRLHFHAIMSAFVYILKFYYIFIVCVLVHMHILVWMIRKTTCRDQLSPFRTWIQGSNSGPPVGKRTLLPTELCC